RHREQTHSGRGLARAYERGSSAAARVKRGGPLDSRGGSAAPSASTADGRAVGHRADGFLGLDRCAARGAEGGPISHTVIMGYDAARETGKSFLMPSAHGQPRWSHVDFVLVSRINRQDTSPLVLVVDDSAATRELYSTYLRAQGLRVLVATDGAIGVRMAVASRPDVIVMDLSMPMLAGWAALRALNRARGPARLPILACTGHREGRVAAAGM